MWECRACGFVVLTAVDDLVTAARMSAMRCVLCDQGGYVRVGLALALRVEKDTSRAADDEPG